MGAFIAFQPAAGDKAPGWDRARAFVERVRRLPLLGQAGRGARVAKYGRRFGDAAAHAEQGGSWLAAAGTWTHLALEPGDDPAALLYLLEREGADALDALEGTWSLVWFRARDETLFVALDWTGRLHTVCAETAHGCWIATSAAALGAALGAAPDAAGVFELLATGTLREGRTVFQGVRRLPPGARLEIRGGRIRSRSQTEPWMPVHAGSRDALVERLLAAYDAVLPRLAGPNPLVDLTGGLDSRVVAGLVARTGTPFDVTMTGEPDDPDVAAALRAAARLGRTMLRVPGMVRREAAADPERVLDAAALCEANFDALEFAGGVAVHERHAGTYSASVNGSGGALFRNYWWRARERDEAGGDPAGAITRHLGAAALDPGFLAEAPDPSAHLEGLVRRALAACGDAPLHVRYDWALLVLRIVCWQGAFASATNQLWPTLSPFLWRGPALDVLTTDAALRTRGRLLFDLLARFGPAYAKTPLESGFPPMPATPATAWRFVPGLLRLPQRLARRLRASRPAAPCAAAGPWRAWARDYLAWPELAAAPLFDRRRYEAFHARGESAPVPLLGRLLALEATLRRAVRAP